MPGGPSSWPSARWGSGPTSRRGKTWPTPTAPSANSSDSAEAFARSREIYESLLLEKPDEPRILRNLSQVHKYVAGLHYRKGEYRPGLDLIVKARAIDEKLLAANPENPRRRWTSPSP